MNRRNVLKAIAAAPIALKALPATGGVPIPVVDGTGVIGTGLRFFGESGNEYIMPQHRVDQLRAMSWNQGGVELYMPIPKTARPAMKYTVVTTCNYRGWEATGRKCVESFRRHWPIEVDLVIYAEDFEVQYDSMGHLPAWHSQFKLRHIGNKRAHGIIDGRYDFRHDAVKFSHKVAAITDAAEKHDAGILIWMDADVFTHAKVTIDWLDQLAPVDYMAWLDRTNCYPECGFLMFNCAHKAHRGIMRDFRNLYEHDELFSLKETHDSYVLEQLIKDHVTAGTIQQPKSLSGKARRWHHPFVSGPLGRCLDHAKGRRKDAGRSSVRDLMQPRNEEHWRR